MLWFRQSAFTLIELVITLVIVVILAAVAVPRFISAGSDARQADTDSVAAALNTASAANYALGKAGSGKKVTVSNCSNVANALPANASLPSGYTITSASIGAGASLTCTVTNPDGSTTATFIGLGVA